MTGAVLNVVLDPLFIFCFGLGVQGAAIATILSQFISFWILLFIAGRKGIPVRLSYFKFQWSYYVEISHSGLPSLFRQMVGSLATIIFNWTAGIYGDEVLAAFTIVNRITFIANAVLVGFGHGFQPICGFNYGAKLYERVKRVFTFCVKVSTVGMAVLAVTEFAFAALIVGFFGRKEPELVHVAVVSLRLQCLTFPLLGMVTLTQMMLQSMGRVVSASILSAGRQGLFLLPVLWIFVSVFGLGGVMMAQPFADLIALAVATPHAWKILKELERKDEIEQGLSY